MLGSATKSWSLSEAVGSGYAAPLTEAACGPQSSELAQGSTNYMESSYSRAPYGDLASETDSGTYANYTDLGPSYSSLAEGLPPGNIEQTPERARTRHEGLPIWIDWSLMMRSGSRPTSESSIISSICSARHRAHRHVLLPSGLVRPLFPHVISFHPTPPLIPP
jgi:hypothetical protein